jgi:hypothetical protein
LRIAYFVHDLGDPAVDRRIRMLRAVGAEIALLGFRRAAEPIDAVAGVPAEDLGQTHDARLAQRAGLTILHALNPRRWRRAVQGCDVVMARNLEMLAIAARVRDAAAPAAALVYECLDIHRLMLNAGPAGMALRALERRLLGRSRLLIVSSPAFVDAYFQPRQALSTPHLLLENKVFDPAMAGTRPPIRPRPPGPPWRIGWFGMIRCHRSLDLLAELARRNPGLVEVVIRGRPAYGEFDDFQAQVDQSPGLAFGGPYRPQDLPDIYGDVHFTWAIDYFDEGRNSSWLLPNRLYEGALFGSVSLALAGVETGRWVAARAAGVVLNDPLADAERLLRDLTVEAYRELQDQVLARPLDEVATGVDECRDLVRTLAAGVGS